MKQATQDSEQIAAGLDRISAFLRMAGWRAAEPRGLTPTQAACLSLLAGRGPSRVGILARALGVTSRLLHPGEQPNTILAALVKRMGMPAVRAASMASLIKARP